MAQRDVSLLLVALVCCVLFVTRISWIQPFSQLFETCGISPLPMQRKVGAYIPSHRSSFLIPNLFHAPEFLVPNGTLADIQKAFVKFLWWNDYKCNSTIRIGRKRDGGWDMCFDHGLEPTEDNCLVYSFGIAKDFSFDDHVAKLLRCEVHSFDPSIGKEDHIRGERIHFHDAGLYAKDVNSNFPWQFKRNKKNLKWKLFTLKEFMEELNHRERVLDILKFDIENAELYSLPNMIEDGLLLQVKQIAFELHLRRAMSLEEMYWISVTLLHLDLMGYKQWHYHENRACLRRSPVQNVSLCHELYFVNTNFLDFY